MNKAIIAVCEEVDEQIFTEKYFWDLLCKVTTELKGDRADAKSDTNILTGILRSITSSAVWLAEPHVTVEDEDLLELDEIIYNYLLGIMDIEEYNVPVDETEEDYVFVGISNKTVSAIKANIHNWSPLE